MKLSLYLMAVFDGRRVQNVLISDATGQTTLSLWEDSINLVKHGKSYDFTNLTVKNYNDKNTLFTPKVDLIVNEIDDLEQALPLLNSIKRTKTLEGATIIAVSNFNSGYRCLHCTEANLVSLTDTPGLGKCPSCQTTALTNSCKFQVFAKLHLIKFQVTASGVNLSAIANKPLEDVTETSLLLAPPFTATYSTSNMTVTNIYRST